MFKNKLCTYFVFKLQTGYFYVDFKQGTNHCNSLFVETLTNPTTEIPTYSLH